MGAARRTHVTCIIVSSAIAFASGEMDGESRTMNAPAKIEWSQARFGPDTQHWLPRSSGSSLDHIPGDDGIPVFGTTLAQIKDPTGFTNRMVARFGKVYRAKSFGGRGVSLVGAEANELVLFDRDTLFSSEQGWGDRKSVGEGKGVSVRVDLGGR